MANKVSAQEKTGGLIDEVTVTYKAETLEKTGAPIAEGYFWTTPDDNGNTPMHLAVPEGHCEIVTALLDLGAQVDVKNLNGETALHLAAKKGNEDMVKELLRAGADPLLKTTGGGTAWHIAAAAGHVGILKVLHAHVNVHKIEDSASPGDIQNAVVKGKDRKGTGKNEECPESTSAEGKATVKDQSVHNNPEADTKDPEKNKKETGNKLTDEECLDEHKESCLGVNSASAEGKKSDKDKCVHNNSEADTKDSEKDKKETGNKLTDEECLDEHKESRLGVNSASAEGKKSDKDKCVHNNSEADEKDSMGISISVIHTSRNCCKWLPVPTSRKSSNEAPKNNSSNPDYFSDAEDDDVPFSLFNNVFGTMLLFHHHSKDLPPRRILDFKASFINSICRMKDVDVRQTDKDGWTFLHDAAFTGAEYGVRRLLKKGADVNALNSDGHTPLYLASVAGWPLIISILLKAGASTIINDNGLSVLHGAVAFCQLESVRELLTKTRPNIKGPFGRTPLHMAAAAEENSIAIGQALIKAGAEISPRDHLGLTPLDVAKLVSNNAFHHFLIYQHRASS